MKSELLAAGVDKIVLEDVKAPKPSDGDADDDLVDCADSLMGLRSIYSDEKKVMDEEIDAVEKLMNQVRAKERSEKRDFPDS